MPTEIVRYTALLRAINVGGHIVKMDRLRALFAELGLERVTTFIASGNVLFNAPQQDEAALEARIEQHLHASLGYPAETFLRTPAELAAAAICEPFGDEPRFSLYVGFLKTAPNAEKIAKVEALRTDIDELHVRGRELYWLCRVRSVESKISGARLDRALGGPVTLRNVTTVRNLATRSAT